MTDRRHILRFQLAALSACLMLRLIHEGGSI